MYLSNTNLLQSRPILGRGAVDRGNASTDATIIWTFTESGADGNLIISGGSSVNAITSSTGTYTAKVGTLITSSLIGINWPAGQSTSMSLFVNSAVYTFAGSSSVSSSKVMTNFTASANQTYTINGYVNSYTPPTPPQPGVGQYAYGFLKGGVNGTTFAWVDENNTSQSVSLGQYVSSSTDNPFIFDTTIGISVISGSGAEQVWSSPWTSSFTTGSSSACNTVTFTNPNSGASGNWMLAAYIPCNSTTYAFRLVKTTGVNTYQSCVSYTNDCYFSPGGVYNTSSANFTIGGAC